MNREFSGGPGKRRGVMTDKAGWWGQPSCVATVTWAMMALLAMAYTSRYDFNPSALLRFGGVFMSSNMDRYCRELPRGTVVLQNLGYDGQLYYWVANYLPFSADGLAHVDNIGRYQRIGFPLLSWVLGGGHKAGIMWAMIGLTLIVPGVIAWVVAARLRAAGVGVWWALLIGVNVGTVLSVYNCLTDSLSLLFLALGWLAYEKGTTRGLAVAVLWWNMALLTREQILGCVAMAGLWELLHGRVARAAMVSLSGLGLGLWEGYLALQVGYIPLLKVGGALTWPGAYVLAYLRGLPFPAFDKAALMAWSNVPMILIAALSLVLGVEALWRSRDPAGLQLAGGSVLFLSLNASIIGDSITSAGRVGMGMFFFLVMLLLSRPGKVLQGTILAALLLALIVAVGLCFFPVPPYRVT
jgi:hypothetical protein